MPPCTVDGCTAHQRCKGLCTRHYDAFLRNGSTDIKPRRANGEGTINAHGYKLINSIGKQRPEHVLVVEKALGKRLPDGAIVHHIDEDKLNNSPRNLVVCPDDAYHFLLHQRQRALDACGHANWRKCPFCKQYDSPESLLDTGYSIYHPSCRLEYRRAAYARKKAAGIPASSRNV